MTHIFEARIKWLNTKSPFAYKNYSREYLVQSKGKPDFIGTAAPEYFGSLYHYNPEDLLVVSLSSCHMLSYLALASNSKVEVLSYQDEAQGELFLDNKITRFKNVILNPKITISESSDLKKAFELHEKAHHVCFIANSVNFEVTFQAEINGHKL